MTDPFPNDATLSAWRQAYSSLQAPPSRDCLNDEQFTSLVLEELQGNARVLIADHILQCRRCTDAYQELLRLLLRTGALGNSYTHGEPL